MAKKKDLKKFRGGIRLESTSEPTNLAGDSTDAGIMYYDSDSESIKVHNGSGFSAVGGGSGGSLDTFYTEDFTTLNTFTPTTNITTTFPSNISDRNLNLSIVDAATSTNYATSETISLKERQKGQTCSISFYYKTDTNYADNDIKLEVWDNVNSNALVSENIKDTSTIKKFVTTFTLSSTATSMTYRFYSTGENSSTISIDIDDVEISQDPFVQADLGTITEWKSYSLSTKLNSNMGVWSPGTLGQYRRVGDSIEVKFGVQMDGAGHSSVFTVALPDGLTFDTSKLPNLNADGAGYLGSCTWYNAGSGTSDMQVGYYSSTTIKVFGDHREIVSGHGAGLGDENTNALYSNRLYTDDYISGTFTAPIAEWGSTNTHIVTPAKSNLTDWQTLTSPTAAVLTLGNGSQAWKYRRVGDTCHVQGHIKFGTTTSLSAGEVIIFQLPTGFKFDRDKMADSAKHVSSGDFPDYVMLDGYASYWNESGIQGEHYKVVQDGNGENQFYIAGVKHDGNDGAWTNTHPETWGNNDQWVFNFSFPVQGWSAQDSNFLAALPMTKWKRKHLAQNVTTESLLHNTTGNSNFIFQNLTEGTYRLSGQFRLQNDNDDTAERGYIEVKKGSSVNLFVVFGYGLTSGAPFEMTYGFNEVFTLTATDIAAGRDSVQFESKDIAASDVVQAGEQSTFCILEKLPMHEETDIW